MAILPEKKQANPFIAIAATNAIVIQWLPSSAPIPSSRPLMAASGSVVLK